MPSLAQVSSSNVHGAWFLVLYVRAIFEISQSGRLEATNCRFTRRSIRRHEDGQCQLDELFVLINGVQSTANIFCHISGAALLDPVRNLHDGGFEGQLVFVQF